MKTILIQTLKKTSKVLLAATLLTGLSTGWFLSEAYSRGNKNAGKTELSSDVIVPSFTVNGETLPTVILQEYTISAK